MRRLLLLRMALCLHAGEGMWTFNKFPGDKLRAKYGFLPSQEWLDHVRLSPVRLAEGCSASLVSPSGLVLTNYHCAVTCIQELSTAEKDYSAKGYQAQSPAEELRCPGQEANILEGINDVTAKIFDGNIHSLGGNYGFDELMNRAAAVDSRAVLESLGKIYSAKRVLTELARK